MTSREFSDRVRRRARRAGVQLSGALLEQLETYFRLLDTWNAKINLTALNLQRDPDRSIDRLLIEPLAAVRHLDAGAVDVIDIGSGGGSPAIPMKLARPEAAFTLVESKTRKCAFLREAGRQLRIDLHVETARYEMLLSRPEFHDGFDALTMRAVRVEPSVLVNLQALLRPGGECLLFRGPTSGEVASTVTPLLVARGEFVLVESMQSRLLVLKKRGIGPPPFPSHSS